MKTLSSISFNAIMYGLCLSLFVLSSCNSDDDPELDINDPNARFLNFSLNEQTSLSTKIDVSNKVVGMEVVHDANVNQLAPLFTLKEGYTAYVNGVPQISGNTMNNFSSQLTYEIKGDDNNSGSTWNVNVETLGCKILIDASHGGGVWWYPQSSQTGFDQSKDHQGKAFADLLRGKGFEVTELPRGVELTEDLFYGYYIVIRPTGFSTYAEKEISVYEKLLDRGMNLAFFTDHKKHDTNDELGDFLGLQFEGVANGTVNRFIEHTITKNMTSINYIAGSVLTNADANANINILGWLSDTDYVDLNFNDVQDGGEPVGMPVMGELVYPNSRIFFMGDTNAFEIQPQPFVDNLIEWMGQCNY